MSIKASISELHSTPKYMRFIYMCFALCVFSTVAKAQIEEDYPLKKLWASQADTNAIKKLVQISCNCFKDMQEIKFPQPTMYWQREENNEENEKIERDNREVIEKALNCLLSDMQKHKKMLGLQDAPDSLFAVSLKINTSPPTVLRYIISPAMFIYGIRDCPHVFKFMVHAMTKQEENNIKREEMMQAYQDSLIKVRQAADTVGGVVREEPRAEEFYENAYRKRVKGVLKRVEGKTFTFLIVERPDAITPNKEEKYIWVERPEGGEDVIRNFKKYKGKNAIVTVLKYEIYDIKTKQYERYWRVSEIELEE